MVDFCQPSDRCRYTQIWNRAWCRFACPLRAYMETIAKYTTKLSIEAKHTVSGAMSVQDNAKWVFLYMSLHSVNTTKQSYPACIHVNLYWSMSIDVPLEKRALWNLTPTILSPPKEPWACKFYLAVGLFKKATVLRHISEQFILSHNPLWRR